MDTEDRNKAEYINSILDASLNGIFVCEAIYDKMGRIEDLLMKKINPAYTRIHKMTEEDAIGKKYLSLFPAAKETGVYDLYCGVIETGRPARKEFLVNDAGVDLWFDISAVKLGEHGLVVTFHDFTELKNLQIQLELKVAELARANQNLENFTFASSHDLKEPLRKVLVFADQLKARNASNLNAEGLRALERLEASIHRLRKLVDDLLIYSEVSLASNKRTSINLNQVVWQVVQDLELHFKEKKATIEIEELPVVKGDARQFHQLFQNLIENSLKFSIKDIPVAIKITCQKVYGRNAAIKLPETKSNKNFYQIEIIDNGIGFDPEYADRIFNVFQRLQSGIFGSGVGLFVARKIVENHKGWISASSEEGKGTKVTILLPSGQ